ncbi:MAG: hypothetical protein IKE95_09530 [Methanobrevibacter sp.]|nr:hypothetical protein [Methanobrevibacter sp.]
MNQDLVDEIEYMINSLSKSGFFSHEEIIEILEDQFIEEDIDFSQYDIPSNDFDNSNFNKLDDVFIRLAEKNIVGVHNCGYDLEEGVGDVFELYVHLLNNKFKPEGFCFYTFDDIEEAIYESKLKIAFGDFENDKSKALEIGKIVADTLKQEFDINWSVNVNEQIEIDPFEWDKSFRDDKNYEIEGAYEAFTSKVKE